jgi:hypothetical protein
MPCFSEIGEFFDRGFVTFDPFLLVLGQAAVAPVFGLGVPKVAFHGKPVSAELADDLDETVEAAVFAEVEGNAGCGYSW